MPRRWSRRLAGCIGISAAAAALLAAAAHPEYQAAIASSGPVTALVLEDRHGNRASILECRFRVTLAVSDQIAVQLLKEYALDRAAVIVRGVGEGDARPEDAIAAAATALRGLAPATLRYSGGRLSVIRPDGTCSASISDAGLELGGCGGGEAIRAPIRAALQVVDQTRSLLRRGELGEFYPVQAISFGSQARLLALGGPAPATRFGGSAVIVLPFSNDTQPPSPDDRVDRMVHQVLRRVK